MDLGGYSISRQTYRSGSQQHMGAKKKSTIFYDPFEVPKRQQTCQVELRHGSWLDPNGFQVAWKGMTIVQIGRGSYEKSTNLMVQHMAHKGTMACCGFVKSWIPSDFLRPSLFFRDYFCKNTACRNSLSCKQPSICEQIL